ncbi:MAG: ABC transporter permease subunit [Proteobacteria bacterium]|nr:ABC transporter permease subunit [Pseudomonadota bacterium]
MKGRMTEILLGAWAYVFILILYAPFFVMLILSFQGPQGAPTFPMKGASLFWYKKLLGITVSAAEIARAADEGTALGSYWGPMLRSVVLGLMTMWISTILGALAAMAFRKPFRGSGFIFYLFLLGLITPGVCVGLGLAMFFQKVGIDLDWYTTGLIGHLIWTVPFTFLIMLMTFSRFDTTVEEAASVLGASPWVCFRTVTLPIIAPGIAVSGLFGFTLSFDEFIRTIFLGGPQNTLPLLLLASLTVRVTPKLYALGTVTTVFSILIVVGFLLYLTRRRLST